MSDDEQRVYSELMRVTGAHMRDDYHERFAAWVMRDLCTK